MLERATHRGVACGSRNLRGGGRGGGGGGDGGGGGGTLVSGRLGVLPITPVTDEKSSLSPNSSLARSSRELYSAHAPQNPSGSALHHNTPVSLYGTQSFTMTPPPMSNSFKHRLPSCVHFAVAVAVAVAVASAKAADPANATKSQIPRIHALLETK